MVLRLFILLANITALFANGTGHVDITEICMEKLVSGQQGVPDSSLTASSIHDELDRMTDYSAARGRLNSKYFEDFYGLKRMGMWSPKHDDIHQYIQVELNRPSLIRGVITQGCDKENNGGCIEYVSKYRFLYSLDSVEWYSYSSPSDIGDTIFHGNWDPNTPKGNYLTCPVIAKYVRINPLEWYSHISLRFEILGCPLYTDSTVTTNDPVSMTPSEMKMTTPESTNNSSLATQNDINTTTDSNRTNQSDINTTTDSNMTNQSDISTTTDSNLTTQSNINPITDSNGDHSNMTTQSDINISTDSNMTTKSDINTTTDSNMTTQSEINTTTNNETSSANTLTTDAVTTIQDTKSTTVGIELVTGGVNANVSRSCCQDCVGKPDGDYQSCRSCKVYVTCSNGVIHDNRPCPAFLVWDDHRRRCCFHSTTCALENNNNIGDSKGRHKWQNNIRGSKGQRKELKFHIGLHKGRFRKNK